MSEMFNASEIYQFAIQIEENGEKFYNQMAEKLEGEQIKKIFKFLASEETQHKKTFQKMLAKFNNYVPPESYPGEYFSYLKAYSDNLLFTFKNFDKNISEINDAKSALHFAIGKELDTIHYFQEMKNLIPKHQIKLLDNIIEEERRHVVKLSDMMRKLSN